MMLLTARRHLFLFLLLYICFVFTLKSIDSCNIWKASECPQPPTADDEEILKYDLYTREQLFRFCDKGKKYAECINQKLHCCDLKSEHAGALAAFEVGLQQTGWRLGRHCSGLGVSTIIQYKCKTTVSPTVKTTTTTRSTTSTMPPCEVERAAKECNYTLNDQMKFDTCSNIREKIQWCKAAREYVACANKYIIDCSIIEVQDDVEQLSNFIDMIIKQSNLNCHGGFSGCKNAITDVRCVQSESDFYSCKTLDSATKTLFIKWYLYFSVALTWCLHQ